VPDGNADTHPDSYANGNRYAFSHRNCDAHRNGVANAHSDCNCHIHPNGYSYGDRHRNRYGYSYGNSNVYRHGNGHGNRHGYGYGDGYSHRNSDAIAAVHANAAATANAVPASLALFEIMGARGEEIASSQFEFKKLDAYRSRPL
jgi:hypothetical protein